MILTIKDVDYLGDYTLLCTFNDGVTKKVDLQPLLKYPAFAELKDKKKFVQFQSEWSPRTEERRVGKEGRSRWSPDH